MIDAEGRMRDGLLATGAVEYRLLDRRGRVVWVRDDALLVEGEDGTSRWHGVMSDITEQKEAGAELERRAARQAGVARLGEHALEGASTSDLVLVPAGAASQAGYTILTRAPAIVADWDFERRFARSPILSDLGARSGLTVTIEGRPASSTTASVTTSATSC